MTGTTPVVYDLGTSSALVEPPSPEQVVSLLVHVAEQTRRFIASEEVQRLLAARRVQDAVERARELVATGDLSAAALAFIKLQLRTHWAPGRPIRRKARIVRTSGLLPTSGRALRGPTALVASIPATGLLSRSH